MQTFAILAVMAAAVGANELTPDTWAAASAGKTVFIKFQAPWWGHCKKMKPDWDTLMGEFEGHKSILIGDVDCTTAGKPLCDNNGVKGFPTIKHGDPANMEDYSGGRDLASLRKFAEGLKPLCSPLNMDLCDAEQKAEIEKIQAMSEEELDALITAADEKTSTAEKTFDSELEKLQAHYKQLQEDKETALAEVKASGIGLIKSVKAAKSAAPAKEEL